MMAAFGSRLVVSSWLLQAARGEECSSEEGSNMLQVAGGSSGLSAAADLEGVSSSAPQTQLVYKLRLPISCTDVAADCGMQWSEEIPLAYASWHALTDAFGICCKAGGHDKDLCSKLTSEAFDRVKSSPFPTEGEAVNPMLCHELRALVTAHNDWSRLGHPRPVPELIETELAQELAQTRTSAPALFEHWVALGLGTSAVALAQISAPAALAAIGAAVAAHLRGCNDPEDKAACALLDDYNDYNAHWGRSDIRSDCYHNGARTCTDCKKMQLPTLARSSAAQCVRCKDLGLDVDCGRSDTWIHTPEDSKDYWDSQAPARDYAKSISGPNAFFPPYEPCT